MNRKYQPTQFIFPIIIDDNWQWKLVFPIFYVSLGCLQIQTVRKHTVDLKLNPQTTRIQVGLEIEPRVIQKSPRHLRISVWPSQILNPASIGYPPSTNIASVNWEDRKTCRGHVKAYTIRKPKYSPESHNWRANPWILIIQVTSSHF